MSQERMGGTGAVLDDELERARVAGMSGRAVILVEGESDRRAIEALARRQARDLDQDGVTVVAIAGATNIQRFLDLLGPTGLGVPLAGLCDAGEAHDFWRALRSSGVDIRPGREALETVGFFVCDRDLEEELIRALGVPAMLELMASQGHARRFRSFQNQPAQRDKTVERQIWRWLGNHKIRYAPLMVDAVALPDMPAPLAGVLAAV